MAEQPIRIRARLDHLDEQGRIRLDLVGALKSMESAAIPMREGLIVELYDPDRGTLTAVLEDTEECWTARPLHRA